VQTTITEAPPPPVAQLPLSPAEDDGQEIRLIDRILSPLRLTVGFSFTAATSAAMIPLALALLPSRQARIKLCNYYGKAIGRTLIAISGVTPIVRHQERIGLASPAIYVSNHTSVLDVFFAIWLCPIGGCGVAKKEIGNIPFFGWLYRLSGHLLIDRENRKNAIAGLDGVAEVVKKHNLSIWMWPEGTRSKDGRLLPIKKGLGHLAIATGLPIVPVVINNAHKNWPKKQFVLRPTTVEVDILEPIRTDHWRHETIEDNLAEVHRAFAEALNPGQKPLPLRAERGQPHPPNPLSCTERGRSRKREI
jgi:lysophosphatidate acyltransferase